MNYFECYFLVFSLSKIALLSFDSQNLINFYQKVSINGFVSNNWNFRIKFKVISLFMDELYRDENVTQYLKIHSFRISVFEKIFNFFSNNFLIFVRNKTSLKLKQFFFTYKIINLTLILRFFHHIY